MGGEGNLRPFKKGQSGNPAGRPKGQKLMSTLLREWINVKIDFPETKFGPAGKRTAAEAIVLKLMMRAMNGDIKATKEILDRLEGKPIQKINYTDETVDTREEQMRQLRVFADQEGIPFEEFCLREGIRPE